MKSIILIISIVFWLGCKVSKPKDNSQSSDEFSSHKQESVAQDAFIKFEKVLQTLYSISETNSNEALLLADKYLKNYNDTIKARGFSVGEIGDLHYLKGEIFYKLGDHRNSLLEFKYTSVNGNLGIASNYMKLKDYDSAYLLLTKESPGYYLYDYELANYFEMTGKKDSAINLYKSILKSEFINNGNYNNLKARSQKRLAALLSNKNPLLELYFPTNNPKIRNDL